MRSLILLLLLSFSAPALAIYKCEFSDKVVYSDLPCKNGKMKKLSIAPPLSDQCAGEAGVAVGEHQQAGGHLLRGGPGLHHEGVVDGQTHHADAALLELGKAGDVAGQVARRAGRRERAGYAEQHDLAAGEQGAGLCRLDIAIDDLDGYVG